MQNYASKVSEGMALQLGCLELRYVSLPVPACLLQWEGRRGRGSEGWGRGGFCRKGGSFQLFLCCGGGMQVQGWLSDVPPFSQEVL